jgi:putative transcriptional regulator
MITVNLDVMMAKRKMSLNALSEKVGITLANLSILKNNKAKAIRFSTLDAICKALDCEVGDILVFEKDKDPGHWNSFSSVVDLSQEYDR